MSKSSKEQLEVINAENKNGSPIVVVAGAGSGKTTTIINRIIHDVNVHNINPSNIFAISFTNKSALDVKERIIKAENKMSQVTVSTFHSLALRIIKDSFDYKFKILDPQDNNKFIKKIYDKIYKQTIKDIKDAFYKKDEEKYQLFMQCISSYKDILGCISKCQNTGENIYHIVLQRLFLKKEYKQIIIPEKHISLIDYLKDYQDDFKNLFLEIIDKQGIDITGDKYDKMLYTNLKLAIKVIRIYEQEKKRQNYKTFDDLLSDVVILLSKNETIRSNLDRHMKYMYVDEFQDVNYVQFKMLQLLNKDFNFLCVVGDSDQAIYSFRGCDKHYFNNFNSYYPDTRVFFLNDNYRSDAYIVDKANISIKNNIHRYDKIMNPIKPYNYPIQIIESNGNEGELYIEDMIPLIREQLNQGKELKDIAILYRNNFNSLGLQKALMQANIPFNVVGGTNFFTKRIIKDIISFLQNINEISLIHLERILLLLPRFGQKKVDKIIDEIQTEQGYESRLNIISKHGAIPYKLYNMLKRIFLKKSDLITELDEYIKIIIKPYVIDKEKDFEKQNDMFQDINLFLEILQEYLNNGLSIEEILEILTLDDDIEKDTPNSIVLSTIHRSKGLEWDTVFIAKAYNDIFPSKRVKINPGLNNFLMEEERNLFYVAITRAKNHLYILQSSFEYSMGKENFYTPSMFVNEINNESII